MIPAVFLLAADLSGLWAGQVPGRNGILQDIAFKLEQTGSKISGKQYGDYQSSAIVSGAATSELITFVVATPEQSGNQINQTRIRFTGRLVNGELELIREREAATDAASGASVAPRALDKRPFRLKKVI